jgi:hypothetical protein
MTKNLPPKAHELYIELIQEFWRYGSIDFNFWHATILNTSTRVREICMIPIITVGLHSKRPLPRY